MSNNADEVRANGGARGRAPTDPNRQLPKRISLLGYTIQIPAAANDATAAAQGDDDYINPQYWPHDEYSSDVPFPNSSNGTRQPGRRRVNKRQEKPKTIPPQYPWATDLRAQVHPLTTLRSRHIQTITGQVYCRNCDLKYDVSLDLESKFAEVATFLKENKSAMRDRAPRNWKNPTMPACNVCRHPRNVKPVIADKKRAINWLFLLLSQTLGFCTLDQLKYFCKHTSSHRTGAKDRVLYLTYLALCKQLDPEGPFDLR
uniref:DUF7086 domain-containing protein n=1 Tax=Kalanchoe fedtschenkoi TaxID=63787 RepID=A0A7N0T3G7_KALFE